MTESEDGETLPIPRFQRIFPKSPPVRLDYSYSQSEEFNPHLFQVFYSLVHFHLTDYNLISENSFSKAFESFATTFDLSYDNSVLQMQIIRKFLLTAQQVFFSLVSLPDLQILKLLHNDLFLASKILSSHKHDIVMLKFCELIMAETLDLYSSEFLKEVEKTFAINGKTAEDVINSLLRVELISIRSLNIFSSQQLSSCIIQRTLDVCPQSHTAKINSWAKENNIPVN